MIEKYAVVTGASSGIGKEFAYQLSNLGYNLVLIARREERLKAIAQKLKTKSIIIEADLSNIEECYKVVERLKNVNVSILINNAGFGDCGEFTKTDLEKELNMIDVNIKAVHILTKLFLERFKNQKDTYILNVASVAGLMPSGPYMATYYASKAYVASLTQAIAKEVKDNKFYTYVGCLCPGPVRTEFDHVANVKFSLKGISSEKCVTYAIKKMKKRKIAIIPTFLIKCAYFLSKISPRRLTTHITSKQQKRKIY